MFDTATSYGGGHAEELLGTAIKGRRDKVIISTKAGMPRAGTDAGPGSNAVGTSRQNLTAAIEKSLRRLGTDYIDLFQLHTFDGLTPVEESLSTLDSFVRAGKIRYLGVSNFAGWQLMKALGAADRLGLTRYVAHQVYYSLIGRDYEIELMPLAVDQGLGAVVWSPLGWGRLTGRIRRGVELPATSRLHRTAHDAPPFDQERLFDVIDVLVQIAQQTGKLVPQVALNWLLQRPTVSTIIVGARDEAQLRENIGALGCVYPLYPHWHQRAYMAERIPVPV
jgi:aryl-alcohol dehydrogenase-like predicted oxidoreductase